MKLEAEIALLIARRAPREIAERVTSDPATLDVLGLSRITLGRFGEFRYIELADAVAKARSGESARVPSVDGASFSMAWRGTAFEIRQADQSDDGMLVPELSLISPNSEDRIGSIRNYAAVTWPHLCSVDSWLELAARGPFSEPDLLRLIGELQGSAGQRLPYIRNRWLRGGEMPADELFPSTEPYYRSLIGSPRENASAQLDSDVSRAVLAATKGGEGYIRWLLTTSVVPNMPVARSSPTAESLASMSRFIDSRSPYVLLGIIELCLRAPKGQYDDDGNRALLRLYSDDSDSSLHVSWTLFPSLVRVALRRLANQRLLGAAPPDWRRLASFVHANALLDTLPINEEGANAFSKWCDGAESEEEVVSCLVDLRHDPLWSVWECTESSMRMGVRLRLEALRSEFPDRFAEVGRDAKFPAVSDSERALTLARRAPFDDPALLDIPPSDEGGLDEVRQAVKSVQSDAFSDAWAALSLIGGRFRLDASLIDELSKVITALKGAEADQEKYFTVLLLAARIASCQGHEGLANAVAQSLIGSAPFFDAVRWSQLGLRAMLVAGAAVREKQSWERWTNERLTDFAFRIPKGAPALNALPFLSALAKKVSPSEDYLIRATKFALCAVA